MRPRGPERDFYWEVFRERADWAADIPADYMLEVHEYVIEALQEGCSVEAIIDALIERFDPDSVNPYWRESARVLVCKTKSRWERYLKEFAPSNIPGRPKALTPHAVLVIVNLLKLPPSTCGYATSAWSVNQLIDALRRWNGTYVSDSTIRRALHYVGYSWNGWEFKRDPAAATTGFDSFSSIVPTFEKTQAIDQQIVAAAVVAINAVPPDPNIPPPPPRVIYPSDYTPGSP